MISPRRTRLLRVPDLKAFQHVIVHAASCGDPWQARSTVVIVPTRAAGEQLRRTLERQLLHEPTGADGASPECRVQGAGFSVQRSRCEVTSQHPAPGTQPPALGTSRSALVLPDLVTRDDLYGRLHERLDRAPRRLTDLERHVLAAAAAREAIDAGFEPPFKLRAGLISELVGFYDHLRRHQCSVDAFERQAVGDFGESVDFDRGARRLLRQTRFLVAAFRAYERRVGASGALDEHGLRDLLIARPARRPIAHIIVTVGDRSAEPAGLWSTDFDLLTRLPGLHKIDLVATEALLATGLQERLHQLLPGIEEEQPIQRGTPEPVLVVPDEGGHTSHFTWRDREDELMAVLRRLKCQAGTDTAETRAIVFHRPLPYLYLSKHLCEAAGVPYEAFDALPLAVEPFATAIDLLLMCVTSGYSRRATVELLRYPHFVFEHDGTRLDLAAVEALDRAWQDAGGGANARELLTRLGDGSSSLPAARSSRAIGTARVPAAAAALSIIDEIGSLEGRKAASELLGNLLAFLRKHLAPPHRSEGALVDRETRARAAILGAIESHRQAHVRHDDRETEFIELVPVIRRWIETQTFTPRTGSSGIVLVDTQAARYGVFSDVSLVGLVEGEWPERRRRNIFYPASLVATLGWPRDRDRSAAERAAFQDLLLLPSRRVIVSTFTLEDDTAVSPSTLLEDVADCGLTREVFRSDPRTRITADQALSETPIVRSVVSGDAVEWLDLRLRRPPVESPVFHGAAGRQPPCTYAVSSVERYLHCPFRYFAAAVLRLKEERDDEPTLTIQERGTLLHRALETFYARWQEAGRTSIDIATLDHALAEFSRVVEEMVSGLPEADRAAERAWLLGSAAEPGVAHRLFTLEIDTGAPVVERLLEMRFDDDFELVGREGPCRVRLRGVADRIDLHGDGTLRVVDYKTGRAPEAQASLQLPIYGVCAEQQLAGYRGRPWRVGETVYAAFGDPRLFVRHARGDVRTLAAEGQRRMVDAITGIEEGTFPPRPIDLHECTTCPYPTVCRKDYVGEE